MDRAIATLFASMVLWLVTVGGLAAVNAGGTFATSEPEVAVLALAKADIELCRIGACR